MVREGVAVTRYLPMRIPQHPLRNLGAFLTTPTAQLCGVLVGSRMSLPLPFAMSHTHTHLLKIILDILVCNNLGIFCGMLTCRYLLKVKVSYLSIPSPPPKQGLTH